MTPPTWEERWPGVLLVIAIWIVLFLAAIGLLDVIHA